MPEPKNDDVDENFDLPDVKDGEEDKTDYKSEAQKLRDKAIRQREKTKTLNAKIKELEDAAKTKEKEDKGEKKEGLDRIDRAVLRAEKITDPEEIKLVEEIMKETGKDVEGVLASKYFQGELKSMRDSKAVEDATPDGKKRAGNSTKDTVDYWLAKDELPPTSQVELRRQVVNAKIAKQKQKNNFSDNPIQ